MRGENLSMDSSEKERVVWLDLARTIAIICVVMVHSIGSVLPFYASEFPQYSFNRQMLIYMGFNFGRLGVPVFLMLTGYLLLTRDYEGRITQFWKSHLLPLFIASECAFFLYYVFLNVFVSRSYDFISLVRTMLFIEASPIPTAWYLPMILGVYVFLPFVAIALKKIDAGCLIMPILLVIIYYFIFPETNFYLSLKSKAMISTMSFNFSGGIWALFSYRVSVL